MAITRSTHIKPEILKNTPCELNHACLSGHAACNVEPFVDRDLELLRCKDERDCPYKRNYNRQFICSCPVKKAAFGLA